MALVTNALLKPRQTGHMVRALASHLGGREFKSKSGLHPCVSAKPGMELHLQIWTHG